MVALTTKEKLQMITIIASLHRTAQLKFSQQKMLFFFQRATKMHILQLESLPELGIWVTQLSRLPSV